MNLLDYSLDEFFMRRCLQLAASGLGCVQPNPMVGAVIVHQNKIIGEGWHQKYGQPHAEVNAIRSVKEQQLLPESTLYVNLEPCSHFGKTPPCADLIIENKIPKVVIACADPNKKVSGKGIQKLLEAKVEVVQNVLLSDAIKLNKRFFTYHILKRPYIVLKWAETADGFIDLERNGGTTETYWITNTTLRVLTHKMRNEEQAILVGYNTYINDKPQLTNRLYGTHQPQRFVSVSNKTDVSINKDFTILPDSPKELLQKLYEMKIQSVVIEGGAKTLERFIEQSLWDEAIVLRGACCWNKGVRAPRLQGEVVGQKDILDNQMVFYRNADNQLYKHYCQYFDLAL